MHAVSAPTIIHIIFGSVNKRVLEWLSKLADPNKNPDPYVLGPPGSGIIVRGKDTDPDPTIMQQK